MGRALHKLTAKAVQNLAPGMHSDGGGLYLLVKPTGARSWIFRFRHLDRLRDMGLGSVQDFTLAEARARAAEQRKLRADGIDPIEARAAARARPERTWGEAVEDFLAVQAVGWKNDAQENQWRQSLADYGPAWDKPVAAVDTQAVLRCLRAIWTEKTETATRVRGRIERIWDAERVAGVVSGDNPARWRGHLEHLLPPPAKVRKVEHFAAMPYVDVPAFMAQLQHGKSLSRRALAFTILTAARTAEVTNAEWREFDLEAALWTIPAGRMKAAKEHVVPLSRQALAVLKAQPRDKAPFGLSENAMLYLLQKDPPKGFGLPFTVHGFRSSFRDWTADQTNTTHEVAEMALAHVIKSKTEKAYRRGQLLEKRRELAQAWADFCLPAA
jgi:integrase